jgi:hypothetical protein
VSSNIFEAHCTVAPPKAGFSIHKHDRFENVAWAGPRSFEN